jgi:hypothetical protein
MCGPIALALPATEAQRGRFVAGRLLYNGGRIVTYIVLGAALGSLGGLFALAGLQQALSIAIGAVMILALVVPAALRRFSSRWSLPARLHGALQEKLGIVLRQRTLPSLFTLGLLNGLLPCGLLFAALGAAAALGEAVRGMLFLGGFGAGTLPVMAGIALAGKSIRTGVRRRIAAVLPVFTFALGVLLILRGLNLGIPYVSPAVVEHDDARGQTHCH